MEKEFHVKEILKRLCYYKWKVWYKLFSSSGQKIFCAFFYHSPNIILKSKKYPNRAPKPLCSNTLTRNELKVYNSLKENKLVCFTNSQDSFQVRDLVRDFLKPRDACFFTIVVHTWTKNLNKQGTERKLCA